MRQLFSQNDDFDITSQIAVFTGIPNTGVPTLCQGLLFLGDGAKNLAGVAGDYEISIDIGDWRLEPHPQTIAFSTGVMASVFTSQFPVPANTEVDIYVLSPNAGDSDVDITTHLYEVSALQPVVLGRQLDVAEDNTISSSVTGVVEADITKIHGTALTETEGQLAARFSEFFDQVSGAYNVATELSAFMANLTDTNAKILNVNSDVSGIPTTAEFEARTLPSGDYFNALEDGVYATGVVDANVVQITGDTSTVTNWANTIVSGVPTTDEFNARTLLSDNYATQARLVEVHADVSGIEASSSGVTTAEVEAMFTEIKGAGWAADTDTLEAISTGIAGIDASSSGITIEQLEARTLPSGLYNLVTPDVFGTAAALHNTTDELIQDAIDNIAGLPDNTTFISRTLPSGDYFNPITDTVANVTTVNTTTTNTDLVGVNAKLDTIATDVSGIDVSNSGITIEQLEARTLPSGDYFNLLEDGLYTYGTVTADPVGAPTLKLSTSASSVDNYYNNHTVFIDSGPGVGQSRTITAYNGFLRLASVNSEWATDPDTSSTYVILPSLVYYNTMSSITGSLADIPTSSEFEARTIPSGDYFNTNEDTVTVTGTIDANIVSITGDTSAGNGLGQVATWVPSMIEEI